MAKLVNIFTTDERMIRATMMRYRQDRNALSILDKQEIRVPGTVYVQYEETWEWPVEAADPNQATLVARLPTGWEYRFISETDTETIATTSDVIVLQDDDDKSICLRQVIYV